MVNCPYGLGRDRACELSQKYDVGSNEISVSVKIKELQQNVVKWHAVFLLYVVIVM